jgi:hypothetical protein
MKRFIFLFFLISSGLNAQTIEQLKDSAATFPTMPRSTADMTAFVQGIPTFASGAPFNDLDFTILDTDYMDGENSGSDVFLPVDPSDPFPGSNKVKYIRCILNTDLNEVYGSADADRVILGTHELPFPFFLRGEDGVDNDYAVIHHLDFEAGYIQLKGVAEDYDLVYCTLQEGCQTEGWYLFYTAGEDIDLIAFIYPCWDIEPSVSGNPPNNLNPICNGDSLLSLTNPTHFRFAEPIETEISIPEYGVQYGSDGKEILGGMTVDSEGNAYFFGATDGNLDGMTDSSNELFIVRINADGSEAWVTELTISEGSMLKDGATDDDFLYVCGRTLGALPGHVNAGRWDGILLKLDRETGAIIATDQWGNEGIDGYGNITLDDNGNLFVSAQGSPPGIGGTDDVYLVAKHHSSDLGNLWRELNPPNATGFIASAEAWGGLTYAPGAVPGDGRLIAGGWYFSATGANAFVSVYENLNSTSPTRPHSEIITAPGIRADWVLDNAVDSEGNIYVAGFTTGNLGAPPLGEGDAFVIRFSPALTNPVYRQFGTSRCDVIRKLEIQNDTLFAIGYTYGDYAGMNADDTQNSGDIFIQKLDTDLNLAGNVQFGTPHEERGYGLIKGDRLYLGGMTEGNLCGESFGSFDAFLSVLSSSTLEFVPLETLGLDSPFHERAFKVYPNPTADRVEIKSSFDYEGVYIFNSTGRQLKHFPGRRSTLDLYGIQPGFYLLGLKTAQGIATTPLIITR